ncbi:hypothetical protein Esi_0170_0006 [Ectocarpus siliculosus]|uniref:Uncharacterized protein n=1 Tax=Ectocarpus siliculosus TaxID=2880 RepID=D7FMR6_ECTSI|nr:hypothetical protein Esi_0170_0006 [Ectocarpus siliculosus]|eukprot:CBJ29981.1 hypothetical protein Esi_0170_0006 [Ectocarpus siliculosus]
MLFKSIADFHKHMADNIPHRCPKPCYLFVAQTAKEGQRPEKAPLTCELCQLPMAPHTACRPRNDEGSNRRYNHVNATECIPNDADKRKCGMCNADDVDRVTVNAVGREAEDQKVICHPCFLLSRTDNLQSCQPAAIHKWESKKLHTSPAKRARLS